MATSLSELRKNRGNFETLQKEVEKIDSGNKNYDDDRFWQPTVDKAGNGTATIRFLPAAKGGDLPWCRLWTHGFKGPTGKWYIENSLTTLGQEDPVGKLNSELWNEGSEKNKQRARDQKRKLNYISNILVIKDPANPANDGKVFLFKYGKKIFDKIKELTHPGEDAKHEPINPFDFDAGSTFTLRIRQVEGFRNYDKSSFEVKLIDGEPVPIMSAIAKTDKAIEAIWTQEYSLVEFTDPKNFKSFDELQKKLDQVLNTTTATRTPEKAKEVEEKMREEPVESAPEPAKSKKAKVEIEEEQEDVTPPPVLDEEDAVSYFEGLAAAD